jgi:YegS/Rv2252/BmrU family lipid kinase
VNFLVIANRFAGNVGMGWKLPGPSPARRIEDALRRLGAKAEIYLSADGEEATRLARQASHSSYDAVVAAGGDGTISSVVNGLVGGEVPLGLIPIGTENVLARDMGIPLSIAQACRRLVKTRPRVVDVGRLGDRFFLCFAGIGFDAQVVREVPLDLKGAMGSLAYVVTALRTAPRYLEVERRARLVVDGQAVEHEFWLIVIGNIASYGGKLKLTPRASPQDGLLDVCVFRRVDVPGLLMQVGGVVTGTHVDLDEVAYYQARSLEVHSEPPAPVQVDGDPFGSTPCLVQVVPAALKVKF